MRYFHSTVSLQPEEQPSMLRSWLPLLNSYDHWCSCLVQRFRDSFTNINFKDARAFFLVMIGLSLIMEGWDHETAEKLHLKNYIYFGMAFSFTVEMLNMVMRKRMDKNRSGYCWMNRCWRRVEAKVIQIQLNSFRFIKANFHYHKTVFFG